MIRGSSPVDGINFHLNMQVVSGNHPASYSYSFIGLKRLRPEINHLLLYNPEVKKQQNYASASVIPS
jgi:hypothetical protein